MTEIQTYQDGTSMGTFSQIKLDNGNKIMISLTQTEIAIFKVWFFSVPIGILWKHDMNTYLDIIYPEGLMSNNADKSVLEISVALAMQCGSVKEIKEKFYRLVN